MSRGKLLAVFCYDVSADRGRARLSRLLEADATRVQDSVFEGWMSEQRAVALGERASDLIASGDSLRVYLISPDEAMRTRTFGTTAPVERDEFHLL